MLFRDHGQAIRPLDRSERREDALFQRRALRVLDEVRQGLGIRLGREAVAGALEPLPQHVRVLDDAVVHHCYRPRAVGVRVRVPLRGRPVRSPARVADAAAAGERRAPEQRAQTVDSARELPGLHAATVQHRDTDGVVAPILEAREAVHQHRRRFPRPHVPHDTAHRSGPFSFRFEQRVACAPEPEPGQPGQGGSLRVQRSATPVAHALRRPRCVTLFHLRGLLRVRSTLFAQHARSSALRSPNVTSLQVWGPAPRTRLAALVAAADTRVRPCGVAVRAGRARGD